MAQAPVLAQRPRGWPEALFRTLTISHARAIAALIALSLICFLPGIATLQPMDRDEPRFAQATKQMLESGDYVAIRFQDEARNKKPVGIYWLQAASVSAAEKLGVPAARTTIFLYRLPSLLGAIAVVLLTYWALLAATGRREALLAAAFMAATLLLGVEARLAKTDAVLTACCIAMMGGLLRAYLREGLSLATLAAFWLGLALSILVKGPVGPMIVGLAIGALCLRDRSAHWLLPLRPWLGLAVVLVFVLPWFIAIAVETQGRFFTEAVGKDMLGKVGSGQERHWAPPGTYLLVFFATAWPLAPFVSISLQNWWRDRHQDVVAFALAWVLPSWIVFEAVATKLPHYVLPLYPALAFLAVRGITAGTVSPRQWLAVPGMLLVVLIPLAVLLALVFGVTHLGNAVPFYALPVVAAAVLLSLWSWFAFRAGEVWRATLIAIASSAVFSIGVLGVAQPLLTTLKLSPRLAAAVGAVACAPVKVVTAGYREPSLVFLVGTDLAMSDGSGAADFLAGGPCRVALVSEREAPGFTSRLAQLNLAPALVTRVGGFNINGGKRLDIAVYRSP